MDVRDRGAGSVFRDADFERWLGRRNEPAVPEQCELDSSARSFAQSAKPARSSDER